MELRSGLITGIGSLPHKDADAAVALILKYFHNIPFWPQLPRRDSRESMVLQYSENLPCLGLQEGRLVFRHDDLGLERFYDRIIANDTGYFKVSLDYALGLHKFYTKLHTNQQLLDKIEFIKGQITGPFTFAAGINDEKGVSLLHDQVFMQVIIKGLTMKALWQVDLFKEFGKKMIMFIDEPYLGCFGSAYTPINREDVIKGLAEISAPIGAAGALIGVHCCGNTDWSILTDIKTIDIISFDAFEFLDKFILYADNLNSFLKRGGLVCWGIVPTQAGEKASLLVERINEGIDRLTKKGIDKGLLLERLFLSPSCGLGTLDTGKAEEVFQLLSETASFYQKSREK